MSGMEITTTGLEQQPKSGCSRRGERLTLAFHLSMVLPAAAASFLLTWALQPFIDIPQKYSDFIVGNLAWTGTSKTTDFCLLWVYLLLFSACYAVIAGLASRVIRRLPAHLVFRAVRLYFAASFPVLVWLLGYFYRPAPSMLLLVCSCLSIVIVICLQLRFSNDSEVKTTVCYNVLEGYGVLLVGSIALAQLIVLIAACCKPLAAVLPPLLPFIAGMAGGLPLLALALVPIMPSLRDLLIRLAAVRIQKRSAVRQVAMTLPAVAIGAAVAEITWRFLDVARLGGSVVIRMLVDGVIAPGFTFVICGVSVVAAGATYFGCRLMTVKFERAGVRVRALHLAFSWASIPAIAWILGSFLTPVMSPLFLFVSIISLLLIGLMARFGLEQDNSADWLPILVGWHLFVSLALLDLLGLGTALTRIFPTTTRIWHDQLPMVCVAVLAGLLVTVGLMTRQPHSAKALSRWLFCALLLLQGPLPLLGMVLVPPAWSIGANSMSRPFGVTILLTVLLGFAGIVSLLPLWRNYRQITATAVPAPIAALKAGSLLFVLLFLSRQTFIGTNLPTDDYHFGEVLAPWFQYIRFGKIPYIDIYPTHGLYEFLNGWFSQLFFDGSPLAVEACYNLVYGAVMVGVYLLASRLIGTIEALLVLICFPIPQQEWRVLFPVLFFLLLAQQRLLRSPLAWLMVWFVSSFVFALTTVNLPAAILAALPIVFVMLVRAYRQNAMLFLKTVGCSLVAVAVIMLATPVGKVVMGYIAFLLENARHVVVSGGTTWMYVFGKMDLPNLRLSGQAFELLRLSWVIALLFGVPFLLQALRRLRRGEGVHSTACLVCCWIANTFLMVSYTLNRIDVGALSRTGYFSLLTLSLIAPLVLLSGHIRVRHRVLLPLMLFLAVIGGVFGETLAVARIRDNVAAIVPITEEKMRSLNRVRQVLPGVGSAVIEDGRLIDMLNLKQSLTTLLRPGETYADLLNRPALYSYLDQELAFFNSSIYSMGSTEMQLLEVKALREKKIPLILADDNYKNIKIDRSPASLRAYYIYRYVVLNYRPMMSKGSMFMVLPERLPEAAVLGRDTELDLLDNAFAVPFMRKIPTSWGRSLTTLKPRLVKVADIDQTLLAGTQNLTINPKGGFLTSSLIPSLDYDISSLGLSGRKAGMLAFNVHCLSSDQNDGVPVAVSWATADMSQPNDKTMVTFIADANGTVLVPMDVNPRWLLADHLSRLRIQVEPAVCSSINISDIKIYQRRKLFEPEWQ